MTCKRCSDGEATFCISCMTDIVEETDRALEQAEARIAKLQAAVDVAEKAHLLCIDELTEAQEENKKLRAALSDISLQATRDEHPLSSLSKIFDIADKILREGE